MSVRDVTTTLDPYPRYPMQPGYSMTYEQATNAGFSAPKCRNCEVNVNYNTLPRNYPRRVRNSGPTNVVHLYPPQGYVPGVASYPNINETYPYGTMYDYDTSQFDKTGRRVSYGFKAYPLTDRYVREINEYADYVLPVPDIEKWQCQTRLPPLREGTWGR